MPKRNNSSSKDAYLLRTETSVLSKLRLCVLAGITLLAVAIFVAYIPSINGEFILDDDGLLASSKLIKNSDGLYRFWFTTEAYDYWPMTNTSLWIEWRMWGMNPAGYHVTNLILHIAESLLVWIILRKLSIPGAFLAALMFAVHPVNVESVAWISQRKNTLAMLFFLLSILWYLKAEMRILSRRWYWLSLAAFILAMLSKGSVAVLPVLILGIVWWLRPLTRWDLVRTAPFFMVSAILTGVNLWFQTHGEEVVIRTAGFTERLVGAGGIIWFYLYKALLPLNLAFIYPQWHIKAGNPMWWLPLIAALIVTALLWRYRNGWGRPFLFAWGFFCVALLPVLGFTDVGFMKHSLVADHYQHIAIISVIAMAAALWSVWHRREKGTARWATIAIAVAIVGSFTFLTWRQNRLYSDAVTLYRVTLEKNPGCWLANNNLGLALENADQLQQAIDQYRKALRLKPDYFEAHVNLGLALANAGRPQEAIEYNKKALSMKPNFPLVHYNHGIILNKAGMPREAIEEYQEAIRLNPDYAEAHNNLGNVYKSMDQYPQAIEHYKEALRLKPEYSEAHINMGIALVQTGRYQEAIEHLEKALRTDAKYPEAHNNLGIALVQTGRLDEAIEHYVQAIRLKPDYTEAYNNLGNALLQIRRPQEAISNYEKALHLNPNLPEALFNLALALVQAGRPQEAVRYYEQALRIKPDFAEAYSNLALVYAQTNRPADAIVAAQKASEIARSKGQTELAKKIEDWLNSYRVRIRD